MPVTPTDRPKGESSPGRQVSSFRRLRGISELKNIPAPLLQFARLSLSLSVSEGRFLRHLWRFLTPKKKEKEKKTTASSRVALRFVPAALETTRSLPQG